MDIEEVLSLRSQAIRLQLQKYDLVLHYSPKELMAICNGIGAQSFPQILRELLDALHPTLRPVAYIHTGFKEKFGITPALYINQLKIEKSKFLLSCKTYTHDEIAAMSGFNDTKYFYTVFKKITNTTAKKYQNAK